MIWFLFLLSQCVRLFFSFLLRFTAVPVESMCIMYSKEEKKVWVKKNEYGRSFSKRKKKQINNWISDFQEKNLADNDHAVEMEIIKIHQHQGYSTHWRRKEKSFFIFCLDSESSTIPLKDDTMDHYTHERTSHHTSFFSRFWSSSSLSPRFLGLCFLVFIYYIGYGYLQVRFRIIEFMCV